MIDRHDIPISPLLMNMIEKWCDWYEMSEGPKARLFDHADHAAAGRHIAQAVKDELPDWTVFYMDHAKMDLERLDQPREEYCIEIKTMASPAIR